MSSSSFFDRITCGKIVAIIDARLNKTSNLIEFSLILHNHNTAQWYSVDDIYSRTLTSKLFNTFTSLKFNCANFSELSNKLRHPVNDKHKVIAQLKTFGFDSEIAEAVDKYEQAYGNNYNNDICVEAITEIIIDGMHVENKKGTKSENMQERNGRIESENSRNKNRNGNRIRIGNKNENQRRGQKRAMHMISRSNSSNINSSSNSNAKELKQPRIKRRKSHSNRKKNVSLLKTEMKTKAKTEMKTKTKTKTEMKETESDSESEYECPISSEIMINPYIGPSGITYEKEAIFEWLEENSLDPITRQKVTKEQYVPNRVFKKLVERHLKKKARKKKKRDILRKERMTRMKHVKKRKDNKEKILQRMMNKMKISRKTKLPRWMQPPRTVAREKQSIQKS